MEEKLKGGVYITIKDIQILNGCSLRTAKEEHLMVRDSLSIAPKKLTVKTYCEFWKLDFQMVVNYINPYR